MSDPKPFDHPDHQALIGKEVRSPSWRPGGPGGRSPEPGPLKDWAVFLAGEWTREMPKEIGEYPTRTFAGESASTIYVIRHMVTGEYFTAPFTGDDFKGSKWGGWFWSRPIPEGYGLPPVPTDE
jgi:hypothetical protein